MQQYVNILRTTALAIWISFALLVPAKVFGQIQIGVQVGTVMTSFGGDHVNKSFGAWPDFETTLQAGLSIDIPIVNDVFISFQPVYKTLKIVLVVENEFSWDDFIPIDPNNLPVFEQFSDYGKLQLNSLSLPLYFKLISDNQKWQFHVGIETLIPLSATLNIYETNETKNVIDKVNEVNIAAGFGIGYKFKLFKNQFSFDLFHTQGLNNVSVEGSLDPTYLSRIKTTTVETKLTWQIPFNRSKSAESK